MNHLEVEEVQESVVKVVKVFLKMRVYAEKGKNIKVENESIGCKTASIFSYIFLWSCADPGFRVS